MSSLLQKPIEYLKGVGPQRGELLQKELSIFTLADLLTHYPFRYVDRRKIYAINEVTPDSSYVQVKGVVTHIREVPQKRGKRVVATLRDESGMMELLWFQGAKWITKYIQPNVTYIVFGKPGLFNGVLNIVHPEVEVASQQSLDKLAGFQAIYSTTEKLKTKGLDSKGLHKLVRGAILSLKESDIPESLPSAMIERYRFISSYQALKNIHLPESDEMLHKAKTRIKFEEFFTLQLRMLRLKGMRHAAIQGFVFKKIDNYFNQFYETCLPFELTGAQKRVLKEVRRDVLSGRQMNRLLQGDVGSGKTIVALMTMLMAIDNDFQAAMMAPTEILAQQHLVTLQENLADLDLRVELLTGSVKGAQRRRILEDLKEGHIDILIGTHALIEEKVKFKNLGCVVIDEQHRFGVAQRAKLWAKNDRPPHVLVMTATPIPRTLAMTVYGDLDTSVIDELPPGRKAIDTKHMRDASRLKLFGLLKQEIAKGRQVYIVYPLIQESEKMDYKDLQDGYESIVRSFPPPQYQVSIVHGKMKPEDKDLEMQRFINGHTQLMVATTVIEVGVNVPNASVMVIESAERFGLAQLHQLRGRVGRGAEQSYCILMSGHKLTKDAKLRLDTMVSTTDGFEIAEVDLQLRGPGDIEGTQQSGILDLKLADIGKDQQILQEARYAAQQVLEDDPALEKPQNLGLRKLVRADKGKRIIWSRIS